MAISTWVHCFGPTPDGPEQDIKRTLAERGVEVRSFDPYAQGHYGVVLFGEFDQAICDLLRDASGGCRERVLAGCCAKLSSEQTRRLMQSGAADVLSCRECTRSVDEILARLARWEAIDGLLASPEVEAQLVGASPAWRRVLRQVVEVAYFTDASVLILGESGTGKEGVARLIHALDAHQGKRDLVVLDCSTIVPELSGSEFFGHERGAFTGAVAARDGAFAQADHGTLFLDEVGELPLQLQSQLLRVIQEQTFKRVGGNAWQHTAFRLVSATNRDLWDHVQRGEFRADLYFRLASFVCRLPPLRERPEDILPLVRHFLRIQRPGGEPPELDPSVQEYLLGRDYPGNVRDLRQLVAGLLCRYPGKGPITVGCIPSEDRLAWCADEALWYEGVFELSIRRALMQGVGLKGISRSAEETAIRLAVAEADGNLQQAAQRLGVTDRTLQMRRAARRQEP
ncbi:sigma 54-interacting transcriptional regulator [Thiocapsa sp.]|uniref:sigma 54-interacting transcriptional regulator n=1 Tax=Thiocapsa sp. TaxID=2024551 RepID=UPI0025EB2D3E|nr:sigma 54-interacting transcriptional regulator [Thiocapsa sp.]